MTVQSPSNSQTPRRGRRRLVAIAMGAMMLTGVGAVAAQPSGAFTTSSSITVSGNTYKAEAYSCNLYLTSCSWNTKVTSTNTRTMAHTSDVKANGINVSVTLSKVSSGTITGNSTPLAHVTGTVTTKSHTRTGQVSPSIFSVSVASRAKLGYGSNTLSTGWTTW